MELRQICAWSWAGSWLLCGFGAFGSPARELPDPWYDEAPADAEPQPADLPEDEDGIIDPWQTPGSPVQGLPGTCGCSDRRMRGGKRVDGPEQLGECG
jgi:hypothetical protein